MSDLHTDMNVLHGTAELTETIIECREANLPVVYDSIPGLGKTTVTANVAKLARDNLPHNFCYDALVADYKSVGIDLDPDQWLPNVWSIYTGRHEEYEFPGMPWGTPEGMQIHIHPLLKRIRYGDVQIFDEFYLQGANKMALQAMQDEQMRIAGFTAPECVTRIALANGVDDGPMECVQSPVQGNRMGQYRWTGPTPDEWITDFALPTGQNPRVIAAVKMEGDGLLKDYDPLRMRNATPRSLHNASRHMNVAEARAKAKGTTLSDHDRMRILSGHLNDDAALKIQSVFHLADRLVKFSTIASSPNTAPIPDDPASMMMLCSSVGNKTNPDNFSTIMQYVTRLPLEVQGAIVDPVLFRHPALNSAPEAQQYILRSAPLRVE